MHQSIPLSCPQSPPPHGLLRGICPTLQSRGGTFAKFALPVGRAFANPGAIPELFTCTTGSFLSECNYTEDITEKKKSRLAHLSMTGGCKGKYACISSLLIKPEIHSEVGSYPKWINVFQLVNQISVDIIWRTSFIFITCSWHITLHITLQRSINFNVNNFISILEPWTGACRRGVN